MFKRTQSPPRRSDSRAAADFPPLPAAGRTVTNDRSHQRAAASRSIHTLNEKRNPLHNSVLIEQ